MKGKQLYLIGGLGVLLVAAYYFGNKAGPKTLQSIPSATTLGNAAALINSNSDATTQLLGAESQVGVTSVTGPYTPPQIAPSIVPLLKGSVSATGSDLNMPYMTPQQYSAWIAAGSPASSS